MFEGQNLSALPPHEVSAPGHRLCAARTSALPELTVMENLRIGLMTRNSGRRCWNMR